MDKGLKLAIEAVGGRQTKLADALGMSRQALNKWTRVPADRVVAVEKATGISREQLRPDLYRKSQR